MLDTTALSTQADVADFTFPEKLQFLLTAKARYKVAYGGRGGGKSHAFAKAILVKMMEKPQRVLCCREFQNSLADSTYKLFCDFIREFRLEGIFFEILHDSIRAINGGEIRFMGIMTNTNKIRSYEGVDICWIAEAAKISRAAMKILTPTIRKAGSEIWIDFNPDKAEDYIYQTFIVAKVKPPRSIVMQINYLDNKWLPAELQEEMEHDRNNNPDDYLHIWLGKPARVLTGAVYQDEMRAALKENRVTSVPWNPTVPVQAIFDLGWQDHTAIWFVQKVGMNYHIIDYYQNRLKTISHYMQHLRSKEYNVAMVWLPHDADFKDLKTGLSIIELMRSAGFRCKLVPKLSILSGINAVREIFSRCFFDENLTAKGVDALCNYAWNDKASSAKTPVHNAASHGADGFRYFAVAAEKGIALIEGAVDDPERGLEALRRPVRPLPYSGGPGEAWMGR